MTMGGSDGGHRRRGWARSSRSGLADLEERRSRPPCVGRGMPSRPLLAHFCITGAGRSRRRWSPRRPKSESAHPRSKPSWWDGWGRRGLDSAAPVRPWSSTPARLPRRPCVGFFSLYLSFHPTAARKASPALGQAAGVVQASRRETRVFRNSPVVTERPPHFSPLGGEHC